MCQLTPSGAALRQITRVKTIFLSLSLLAGCGWDFEWCSRVLARQLLHAIKGEKELYLKRLLAPECPVVVKRGNAPGWRHIFGASLLCHTRDKVEIADFAALSFHEGSD